MNGIVNLLKPPGMSSHQAVAFLRRQLQTRQIGHTGTLDPGASGVLPLVVGKATRLSQYLTEHDKTYLAELTLGISTTTQDGGGATAELNTDFALSPWRLADVLTSFKGKTEQVPPMASAVRVEGRRLYELARQGITISRPKRQIHVYSLDIERIWSEDQSKLGFGTRILLRIACSKGTYVRTLCHDIGAELGVHGHMSFLTRIQSGPFTADQAYTVEEIEHSVQNHDFAFLLPMEAGLADWTKVKVHPLVEERLKHGNFILPEHLVDVPVSLVAGDQVVLLSVEGEMLALAEIKKTDQLICQPFRVFAGG